MPRTFISFILIGISIFLAVIFVWPKYQNFNNLKIEIFNKEQEIKYEEEYQKEVVRISQKLDERQAEIEKIDSALPADLSLPALLKFLQKITSENGLILTQAALIPAKPIEGISNTREIQGNLAVSGSYSSLKNFLTALENSSRIIDVDSINLSANPKKTSESSDIFSFQIKIRAYSY